MHLSYYRQRIVSVMVIFCLVTCNCFWVINHQRQQVLHIEWDAPRKMAVAKQPEMTVVQKEETIIIEDAMEEREFQEAQSIEMNQDDILEEEFLGDLELLAQLIHAEAGNQDLYGKRLVADVVLNRVESDLFPDTIEEVIFQDGPVQFAVTVDGALERAAWEMDEPDYEAAYMEATGDRIDTGILYFGTGKFNGTGFWQYGDHWFSY